MALIQALRSKSECIPPPTPYNFFVGFQFTFTTRYVLIQYRLINGRRNLFLSLARKQEYVQLDQSFTPLVRARFQPTPTPSY